MEQKVQYIFSEEDKKLLSEPLPESPCKSKCGGYNPLEFKDITDDYLKREIKRSYAVLKLENSSKSDEDLYRTVFWGLTEKYGRSSTSRINALINDICGLRI